MKVEDLFFWKELPAQGQKTAFSTVAAQVLGHTPAITTKMLVLSVSVSKRVQKKIIMSA